MRKLVVLLLLFSLFGLAHAIEITQPNDPSSDAQLTQLTQTVKQLEIRVSQTLTKSDFELVMLANQVQQEKLSQNNSFSQTALMIGIIIMNDILLVGAFIISKTAGWFS